MMLYLLTTDRVFVDVDVDLLFDMSHVDPMTTRIPRLSSILQYFRQQSINHLP